MKPPNEHLSLEDRVAAYMKLLVARMLHRIDWIAEQLALTPAFDCVTKQHWARRHEAWGTLSGAGKASYHALRDVGSATVRDMHLAPWSEEQRDSLALVVASEQKPMPIWEVNAAMMNCFLASSSP